MSAPDNPATPAAPNRRRAWVLALAIFVLGVAVGAAALGTVGYVAVRRSFQNALTGPGLAERAAERIGADLRSSLSLTDEEALRVQGVLDQSATRLRALRRRAALQAFSELRTATEEISAVLPPEKREAYEKITRQRLDRLGFPGRAPR
ncbi:MAG TPA: hypothetical protein PKX00_15380 [Opitutaceae bacterium]|jgi:hypothetical protein|nr:hypothetical protein [Opitutaceae bacterium]HRE06994.1 hypothetical protein [Opitutaceae bacterium]